MDFEKLKKKLETNGFAVTHFATGKEAAEYLDSKIDGKTVASGGSVTIRDLGLMDMLSKHNVTKWHWEGDSLEECAVTDVYLLTANGMAETGEIINIDGTGNRIASSMYGHKEVYYIVSSNKIKPTYDEALWYAKNVVSPKNCQRLNRNTPCAVKADKCYNCSSPESICNVMSITYRKPGGIGSAEIIIVDESLGF